MSDLSPIRQVPGYPQTETFGLPTLDLFHEKLQLGRLSAPN